MRRAYDEQFIKSEFKKQVQMLIRRKYPLAQQTVSDIDKKGLERENGMILALIQNTPVLLEPDCFRVFGLVQDKCEQSEGKKINVYLRVVFDEYMRLLDVYIKDKTDRNYKRLVCLKGKIHELHRKLQAEETVSLETIRRAFEENTILKWRRSKLSFFEPVYTTYEKSMCFGYLRGLISVLIAPDQQFKANEFISKLESKLVSSDSSFSWGGRQYVVKMFPCIWHLISSLEKNKIETVYELHDALLREFKDTTLKAPTGLLAP